MTPYTDIEITDKYIIREFNKNNTVFIIDEKKRTQIYNTRCK